MFEKMEGSPVNMSALRASPLPSFSQRSAGTHSSRAELGLFGCHHVGQCTLEEPPGTQVRRGGEEFMAGAGAVRGERGAWAAARADPPRCSPQRVTPIQSPNRFLPAFLMTQNSSLCSAIPLKATALSAHATQCCALGRGSGRRSLDASRPRVSVRTARD